MKWRLSWIDLFGMVHSCASLTSLPVTSSNLLVSIDNMVDPKGNKMSNNQLQNVTKSPTNNNMVTPKGNKFPNKQQYGNAKR